MRLLIAAADCYCCLLLLLLLLLLLKYTAHAGPKIGLQNLGKTQLGNHSHAVSSRMRRSKCLKKTKAAGGLDETTRGT